MSQFEIRQVVKGSKDEKKALRYNDGKIDWSLVDFRSLEPMVKVLMYGAKKYEIDNWKKGQDLKSLSSCLMRHLVAFMDGEDNDLESGESHLGHILCNAMIMVHSQANHKWTDNRSGKYYDELDEAAEKNETEAIAKKQKGLPFQEFDDLDDSLTYRFGG